MARSVPILQSTDLGTTARFYEALGFVTARPLEDYLPGLREAALVDKDGTLVRVGSQMRD